MIDLDNKDFQFLEKEDALDLVRDKLTNSYPKTIYFLLGKLKTFEDIIFPIMEDIKEENIIIVHLLHEEEEKPDEHDLIFKSYYPFIRNLIKSGSLFISYSNESFFKLDVKDMIFWRWGAYRQGVFPYLSKGSKWLYNPIMENDDVFETYEKMIRNFIKDRKTIHLI